VAVGGSEAQAIGYEIPTARNNVANAESKVGGLGSAIPTGNNVATTIEYEISMQESQVGTSIPSGSMFRKKQPKPKQKVKIATLCSTCVEFVF